MKTKPTRVCRYCQQEKTISNFQVAGTIKGKVYRRHKCNTCYCAAKTKRRRSLVEWIRELRKTFKCLHCGNDDFRVLDFHHKDDNKSFNIGEAAYTGFGREKILAEIKKCDVLCANCHRIETYENRPTN